LTTNTEQTQLQKIKALIGQQEFDQATDQLGTLLEQSPQHQEGLYCLAICQRKQSLHSQAFKTLDDIHALNRQHSPAFQERGYNHQALQQIPQAVYAFETAVGLNPALHGSWRALASMPDYPKTQLANQHLQWLSQLPPELRSVSSYLHQNQLLKAEALCRQFLQKQAHHPEAMRLLAKLGVKFNVLDDAEFLLEKCIEMHPDFLPAQVDYVEVLHRRQKFHKALDQAEKLTQRDPENPAFKIGLANAQQATGDYESAIASYQQVLSTEQAKQEESHSVHLALGHSLKTSGKLEQAIEAYQHAYAVKQDYGDAYWSLANLKTYRFSDKEISTMRSLAESDIVMDEDRIHLCFALGKALEDQNDYQNSFDYYQRGNQLKALHSQYNSVRLKNELEYQAQHFDAQFFSERNEFGHDAADPIFIVGLPRAGSTLLEQILASHSQVDGTLELSNILALAHRFNGRQASQDPRYPSILQRIDKDTCAALGEGYINDTMAHRQGAPFFIDKMPNNFRHIALIQLILPNAKIIDARREPMACCFSGFKQLFAEGQEFSYSLENIGDYYSQYISVMDHWERELPGRILRVQHEDVIEDLEGQVRRILDYCGLEFEQACVDFHKTKRAVRTPSSEQVRQPIFKSAMQQWQNYATFLEPLAESLGDKRKHYR